MSEVSVRVLFFARARELAGVSSATVEVPTGTLPAAAFSDVVIPRYPGLGPLAAYCALAVNLEYVSGGPADSDLQCAPLADGDELAVIPPISGG